MVFPAPKNPDIMVIGIGSFIFLIEDLSLLVLLEIAEEELDMANEWRTFENLFPVARTEDATNDVRNYCTYRTKCKR